MKDDEVSAGSSFISPKSGFNTFDRGVPFVSLDDGDPASPRSLMMPCHAIGYCDTQSLKVVDSLLQFTCSPHPFDGGEVGKANAP